MSTVGTAGVPVSPRRALALAAAVLAVAVLASAAFWWRTHPHRLRGVGNETALPVAVGRSAVVGLFGGPESGRIRIVRVQPRVAANTAGADLRVLLCRGRGPDPVGTAFGTAGRVCASVRDPGGVLLGRLTRGGDYLVLEVTPHRTGTVVVNGLHVEYRAGWQRGAQDSGEVVVVRATKAARG